MGLERRQTASECCSWNIFYCFSHSAGRALPHSRTRTHVHQTAATCRRSSSAQLPSPSLPRSTKTSRQHLQVSELCVGRTRNSCRLFWAKHTSRETGLNRAAHHTYMHGQSKTEHGIVFVPSIMGNAKQNYE